MFNFLSMQINAQETLATKESNPENKNTIGLNMDISVNSGYYYSPKFTLIYERFLVNLRTVRFYPHIGIGYGARKSIANRIGSDKYYIPGVLVDLFAGSEIGSNKLRWRVEGGIMLAQNDPYVSYAMRGGPIFNLLKNIHLSLLLGCNYHPVERLATYNFNGYYQDIPPLNLAIRGIIMF